MESKKNVPGEFQEEPHEQDNVDQGFEKLLDLANKIQWFIQAQSDDKTPTAE